MQTLKTRGIDDTLRLIPDVAGILDGSSSSGEERISVCGHLYGVILRLQSRRQRALPYKSATL